MTPVNRPLTRKAFTLLEMLVVIGIITLLAAILIPVVSQVRTRAAVAQTQGEMMRLMAACQTYFHDWNAYPGPLSENMVVGAKTPVDSGITLDATATQKPTGFDSKKITSSENLVLGLLGLLSPVPGNPVPTYGPPPPKHDVMNLSYTHPASYHYIDFLPDEIPVPGGQFGADYYAYGDITKLHQADWNPQTDPNKPPNDGEAVSDSGIPEFMDHIPNPMPILYMRAVAGVQTVPTGTSIVSATGVDASSIPTTYNYGQLAPYGFLKLKTNDFTLPYPTLVDPDRWLTYFMNPGILNEPRGKNSFVLIDAGPDRLFGTKDDIFVTP